MNTSFSAREAQRLLALEQLHILDTPPEAAFDRVTALAATVFKVPIALVSLIDESRQWFKSCFGSELLGVRETERDIAFCAHAIESEGVFVVPDASLDPRFADNPLVTGAPRIRFYAGALLKSREGFNLGTLCLADFQARAFSDEEAAMLQAMAEIVCGEIERRRAEAEARASEHRLRTLVASASDIITILDAAGTIVYQSAAVERVLGYAPRELEGRIVWELIHPDDWASTQAALQQAIEDLSYAAPTTFRLRHRDGSWRVLEALGRSRLDDAGIAGVVVSSRDVTERQQTQDALRRSEEMLREEAERLAALARAQNAIAVADLDIAHAMERVISQAMLLAGAEGAAIFTPGADGLLASAGVGILAPVVGQRFGSGNTLTGRSVESGHVVRCDDTESDPRVDRESCRRVGLRSLLAAPLRHHERTSWILSVVSSRAHAFSERDEKTLDLLRGLCAAVISRAVEFEERRQAQRDLEHSEKRKAAIVETALDCIITIDSHSRVIEWNPAAEKILGWTREEATSKYLYEMIVPPELRQAHREGLAKYLETGQGPILGRRLELPAVRKDGARITAEVAIVSIPNTDPPLFTGHLRDITGRKEAEARLQEAKEEAERERERAERANMAKSEFLSRMSHELRTPLNAILGFGQLLEMSELEEHDADGARQIVRAGRHLLALINEVLDIARIESGSLSISPEPVALSEVAAEVLGLVRPLAQERGIRLDDEALRGCASYVKADRQRLKQVLLNLLSNAIKYNREGGAVTLSWSEAPQNRLRFWVRDSGEGIAPGKMERLFTPFDRLGAENSGIEGTGIGLALSRRLTELMGGQIGAQSTPGEGTTFWIEMPLAESPSQGLAAEHEGEHEGEKAGALSTTTRWVVLYIEDNLSNLQLLQRVLARRPEIKLLSAMQGSLGLELARQHSPHLILLDLHLPGMDGHEVLRRLRQDPATSHIPVVILSADATPGQVDRLLGSGAQAYLSKPFNITEFMRTLNAQLAASTPLPQSQP